MFQSLLNKALFQINSGTLGGMAIKTLLIAGLIFLLFLLLRNFFVKYLFGVVLKFAEKTTTDLDEKLLLAFQRPLKLFFMILGIYFSLNYLPLSVETNVLIASVFRSSIVILLAWGSYNLTAMYMVLFEEIKIRFNFEIDQILAPFFSKIARFIIIALTLTIVAQEWGYNIEGFIAGLGLGGLAFALAAKDTIANIFAGIVIITDKPFSIGDWVYTPSVEGTIEDINFRSTKIRTFAQAMVTVPNSTLANEPITNWTRMGKRRITFHLGVTYTTPRNKLDKVVQSLKNMLESHPEVCKELIMVRFDKFNDSSLDIFLYFFTKTTQWQEYLRVKENINFRIMEILEQEGVSVAFPSRSIYFETPIKKTQA